MIYDFRDSLEIGYEGEEIVLQYLQSRPNVIGIADVRHKSEFRKLDIDFVVLLNSGYIKWVEVKADTYKSGNFFFETLSCIETDSLGRFYKSMADLWCYYFVNTGELYTFNLPELVKWFKENQWQKCIKQKCVKNYRAVEGETYTTEGYIVPKWFLEGSFTKFNKVNLLDLESN